MPAKHPLDARKYPQDARSTPIRLGLPDGAYVFVRDLDGIVWVLPDGPHQHVKVLGRAKPALYAGDLTLINDSVEDITNLSGTFQFDEADGLLATVEAVEKLGLTVVPGAVRLFSHLDGRRPVVLR